VGETVAVWVILLTLVGVAGCLFATMVKAIVGERRRSGVRRIWSNFGLSIAFATLFLVSWAGQAVAEWRMYVEDQQAHQRAVDFGGFLIAFGQSTLENWQSEFLQLFSFVVFAAVLIHRGSAESKDGTDRIEAKLDRIEERLDRAGIGGQPLRSPRST
jgi:hypothetical protein